MTRLFPLLLLLLAGCNLPDGHNGGKLFHVEPDYNRRTNAPPRLPSPAIKPVKQALALPLFASRTNQTRCTTNCPVAPSGIRWTWRYDFTPPELTYFRFYGRASLTSVWVLLGTNTKPVWEQWFSNAPMQFLVCVAVDRDMRWDSLGKPR